MSRAFFATELETIATYWRIFRRDGVTLGFTTHDRDIYFSGITHRSAPGMVPSAIRKTIELQSDNAEVEGALAHDAISASDLANGLFDGARIEIGAVDWQSREAMSLYAGALGEITADRIGFRAELQSAKLALRKDIIPRTSPGCRAEFCGPDCGLSASKFSHIAEVTAVDGDAQRVAIEGLSSPNFVDGRLRFSSGPQTGLVFGILEAEGGNYLLDRPLSPEIEPGAKVFLLEGCDHTIGTCHARFSNAVNFRGEPFLPGNDLLIRYPKAK